jgi:Zn-dependent M28 family amino/carboxypeptidase
MWTAWAAARPGVARPPTVTFLFSTGEEQGELGVQAYVRSLAPQDLGSIYALVNLDMVGYDGNDDDAMVLYYGDHAPSLALARTMQDAILSAGLPLAPAINPGCG